MVVSVSESIRDREEMEMVVPVSERQKRDAMHVTADDKTQWQWASSFRGVMMSEKSFA